MNTELNDLLFAKQSEYRDKYAQYKEKDAEAKAIKAEADAIAEEISGMMTEAKVDKVFDKFGIVWATCKMKTKTKTDYEQMRLDMGEEKWETYVSHSEEPSFTAIAGTKLYKEVEDYYHNTGDADAEAVLARLPKPQPKKQFEGNNPLAQQL